MRYGAPVPSDYHHGDLPDALRSAAVELIAESGPNGFSLREVARRAGVSHAAPAHHFGGTKGLLTSVAAEGFSYLSDQMAAVVHADMTARERLIALGVVYVETALANPGHYSVMIGHNYTDDADEQLLLASVGAHDELTKMIHELRATYNPSLSDEAVDQVATIVWASVHGLVELAPFLGHVAESTGTADAGLHSLIIRFADMVIDGMQGS